MVIKSIKSKCTIYLKTTHLWIVEGFQFAKLGDEFKHMNNKYYVSLEHMSVNSLQLNE